MSDAEDDYEDDGFEHYEFSAEKATKISSDHNTSSQMLKDASTAAKSPRSFITVASPSKVFNISATDECVDNKDDNIFEKPELKKMKSSPIGKDLETYMLEMGFKDDTEGDHDEEDNEEENGGEEDNSDEDKYAAIDSFEGFDHNEKLQSDSTVSSTEEKLKQLKRLGFSPRTIQAALGHRAPTPQQSVSPEAQVSAESSSGKLGEMIYSSSEGVLNKRSKKSVAWGNAVDYKEKDSQGQSLEAQSLLQSIAQQRQNKDDEVAKKEEDNAARVDALLMELFPGRADLFRNNKGGNKAIQPSSKKVLGNVAKGKGQYGIGVVGNVESAEDGVVSDIPVETQIRALKKELKMKDEKIMRLTEHASMIATYMDKLKGEIAFQNNKIKDLELQLDAKEARLVEALKQKKKKKAKEEQHEPQASYLALEADNIALREREHALLCAVEELSNQNHDLIMKLKDSMQRELELSSKSAAIVSNNLGMLPSILDSGSQSRAHSEPATSGANTGSEDSNYGRRAVGRKKKVAS